jgi:hypothetical protein
MREEGYLEVYHRSGFRKRALFASVELPSIVALSFVLLAGPPRASPSLTVFGAAC